MPIRVIPVLDLKAGRAVRAIGGDRDHYQPLQTRLHPDSDPLGIARSFVEVLQLRVLYLADLDAIAGSAPNQSLYESIRALGLDLWVDAGIRDRHGLAPLLAAGVSTLVIGLETIQGPAALGAVCAAVPAEQLVFSLDLRAGRPVIGGDPALWKTTDPLTLAHSVIALGIRRLLILDLTRVGTGRGTGTRPLLTRLRAEYPELEISVGGGISDGDELRSLAAAGADAALIGAALHDGRIGPANLS